MHCVLYTDGGCKTVAGRHYGGYGFHGYFFTPEVAKKGAGNPKGLPTRLGWARKSETDKAQAVTLLRYLEGYGTEHAIHTNNVAELKAAIEGLSYVSEVVRTNRVGEALAEEKAAKKTKSKTDEPLPDTTLESLVLYTDSEYLVKGINGQVDKWSSNGWKTTQGEPVKNQKLWKRLIEMVEEFKHLDFRIQWVKGHNGDVGNERADLMANLGINHALFDEEVQVHSLHHPDGFWKTSYEYNRLLGTQTWYYNTDRITPYQVQWDETYHVYHLGRNDADDDDHGKRVNNNTYAVVALKEPEPTLEMVRQAQAKLLDPSIKHIAIARLSNLFSSAVYDRLRQYGQAALRANRATGNIYELGKSEISKVLKVPLISYRAIDTLNDLESVLERYLTSTLGKGEATTDITEAIYDNDPKKGKVLKKTITSASPTVQALVNHHVHKTPQTQTIDLVVGMDLPPRNILTKLADDDPVVTVITWKESPVAFRVATVITTRPRTVDWVLLEPGAG